MSDVHERARRFQKIGEVVTEIERAWMMTPELRLGQLLINALDTWSNESRVPVFYASDDTWFKALEWWGRPADARRSHNVEVAKEAGVAQQ